MLAIVVSLLFGLAAFAALAAIISSLGVGVARGRAIFAELAELDRRSRVTAPWEADRPAAARSRPALAAA